MAKKRQVVYLCLLRTILFATLLNDYLKRTYPKKYEDFLVTASFNAVYAFSVIQIKIKQLTLTKEFVN